MYSNAQNQITAENGAHSTALLLHLIEDNDLFDDVQSSLPEDEHDVLDELHELAPELPVPVIAWLYNRWPEVTRDILDNKLWTGPERSRGNMVEDSLRDYYLLTLDQLSDEIVEAIDWEMVAIGMEQRGSILFVTSKAGFYAFSRP